jgi:hypothetical protein
MRPVIILFSLWAAHSLAAPVAVAGLKSNSEGLTTANMIERSVEAEMDQDTRMFLVELERRQANGGIRTHSA